MQYDLIILGSGPGGYVAAIRAGQLGLNTVLVEKDPHFGGTCLHRGCIPTKALLHVAEVMDEIGHAGRLGINLAGEAALDWPAVHDYKRGVVGKNARGIEYLLKKNGVSTVEGYGTVVGTNTVEVANEAGAVQLSARHLLLATGSVPARLSMAPTDGHTVFDSDQMLEHSATPESLVVLGGGAVGCEFASVFASFGSRVTVVEMLDRLVPIEDREISAALERSLRKRGLDVRTETRVEEVERLERGVSLTLVGKDGREASLSASALLVAVGRRPRLDCLGDRAPRLELEDGCVVVNEWMQSSHPSIYAIGDVVKTPWLAHVASAEGIVAVEHLAGEKPSPIDYDRVPSCTYCRPEVASVGLTEEAARARGHEPQSAKFPFSASGKAAILGETEGFVKIVRDPRYDEVLGAHIIGPRATELIAEACAALQLEATTEELVRTMHAHPTLSEAVSEAAHAALGKPIHF